MKKFKLSKETNYQKILKKLLICYHNRDIRFYYFKLVASVKQRSENHKHNEANAKISMLIKKCATQNNTAWRYLYLLYMIAQNIRFHMTFLLLISICCNELVTIKKTRKSGIPKLENRNTDYYFIKPNYVNLFVTRKL